MMVSLNDEKLIIFGGTGCSMKSENQLIGVELNPLKI